MQPSSIVKATPSLVKSADVNKVDDRVYEVTTSNNCLCHECTSGFTTFKTRMKFK